MSVPARVEITLKQAGDLCALADVVYGDFKLIGFKVLKSRYGDGDSYYVKPPSRSYKNEDGETRYQNMVVIPDPKRWEAFQDWVLAAFHRTQAPAAPLVATVVTSPPPPPAAPTQGVVDGTGTLRL